MNEYGNRIEQIIHHFDEKKNKKLQTDIFLRLCNKVGGEDDEITTLIQETYTLLVELSDQEDVKPKSYLKSFSLLKKTVRKKLGFAPKGAIQEEYTAIGIAIGVAFGTVFMNISPGLIGVGLPIGLVLGVSIGKSKEAEAERMHKTF